MNERLEQLKKQAVDYAEEVFVYHGKDYREIVMEKFAELLIRECIEINKQELSFNAFETLLNRYKQHFGVEE